MRSIRLRRCRLLILLVLSAMLLASCNREQENRPTRIALIVKTLNNPYFLEMRRGAEEAAQRLGVELVVQAAEREVDVEKQMQIIENLIQTRVDALCITPSGSREIVPAVEKANAAGIPVVIVDTRLDPSASEGVRLVSFIGSDNYQGGQVAAQFIVDHLDATAKVAVLEGIPGHETGDERIRGFREVAAQHDGIEIVASQPANWERDQGFNVFQNLLQANPEIDTLFACSDLMALGALEAIEAAGKTGEIRVIGFDALDEARAAVESGRMVATVAQFPDRMGRLAVESAVEALKGNTSQPNQSVPIELITKKE